MHWIEVIKDNFHLFLGGALSVFIYREKVGEMSMCERLAYVSLSVALGFYGGGACVEFLDVNPASNRAYLIIIIATIFGLAMLGIARDNLNAIFDKVAQKWLG